MLRSTRTAPREAVELLGELHPLIGQLGSADGLVTLGAVSASLRLPQVNSRAALGTFLRAYRAQMLLPLELPAISRAFHHARRNETRELIALDQELARQPLLRDFASASRRVGRWQLQRLAPLRDERVARRYLQAVREGRAAAWHTVVYGLTLAIYSLPLCQGLISYARHTVRGFVQTAARPLRLRNGQCRELIEELCADLPAQLEPILGQPVVASA